jgi:hypothetical protein
MTLTDKEKQRIAEEEAYRTEIRGEHRNQASVKQTELLTCFI